MALTQTQVSQLYVALFGRASEGEGNLFWQQGSSMVDTANQMLATTAAADYFGAALNDNQAFIEFIYENTLGKTVQQDPDGIAFWVNALNGGADRGEVVVALIDAVYQYADATDPVDKDAYDQFVNRVDVSNYVAEKIQNFDDNYSVFTGINNSVTADGVDAAKAQVDAIIAPNHTFTLTESVVEGEDAVAAVTEVYWGYNPTACDDCAGIPVTDLVSFLTTITGMDLVELGLIDAADCCPPEEAVERIQNITINDISGDSSTIEIALLDGTTISAEVALGESYLDFLNNLLFDENGNSRLFEKVVKEGSSSTCDSTQAIILTPTVNNGGTWEAGYTTNEDDTIVAGRLELLHGAYIDGGAGYNVLEIDAKGVYAQPVELLNIQEVRIENLPNVYGDTSPAEWVGSGTSSIIDLSRATSIEKLVITEGKDTDGTDNLLTELVVVGIRNGAEATLDGGFTANVTLHYSALQDDGVNLVFNNVDFASSAQLLVAQNAETLNIESTGGGNYIYNANLGGQVSELNITGDATLYIEGDLGASLRDGTPVTIDASANTAGVNLNLTASEQVTFLGSQGNDRFIVETSDQSDMVAGIADDSVTIVAQDGNSHFAVESTTINLTAGDGVNTIELDGQFATVVAGDGNNSIDVAFDAEFESISVTVGNGDNRISADDSSLVSITAGDGNNAISSVRGDSVTISAGDGDNQIVVSAEVIDITTGAGDDVVIVSGMDTDLGDSNSPAALLNIAVGAGENTVVLGRDVVSSTQFGITALTGSSISGENITLYVENESDISQATLTGVTQVVLNDETDLTLSAEQFIAIGAENFVVENAAFGESATLTLVVSESMNFDALGINTDTFNCSQISLNIVLACNAAEEVTFTLSAEQLHTYIAADGISVDSSNDYDNDQVVVTDASLAFDAFGDSTGATGGGTIDDSVGKQDVTVIRTTDGFSRPSEDDYSDYMTINSDETPVVAGFGDETTQLKKLVITGEADLTITGDVNLADNFTVDFSALGGSIDLTLAQFEDIYTAASGSDAAKWGMIKGNGDARVNIQVTTGSTVGYDDVANGGIHSSGVAAFVVTGFNTSAADDSLASQSAASTATLYVCDSTQDVEVLGLQNNRNATVTFENVNWGTEILLEGDGAANASDQAKIYGNPDLSEIGAVVVNFFEPGANAVVNINNQGVELGLNEDAEDGYDATGERALSVAGITINNAKRITLNVEDGDAIIASIDGDTVQRLLINGVEDVTIQGDLDFTKDLLTLDASGVDGVFTLELNNHNHTDLSKAQVTGLDAVVFADDYADLTMTVDQLLTLGLDQISCTTDGVGADLNLVGLAEQVVDLNALAAAGVNIDTVTTADVNGTIVLADATTLGGADNLYILAKASDTTLQMTADQFHQICGDVEGTEGNATAICGSGGAFDAVLSINGIAADEELKFGDVDSVVDVVIQLEDLTVTEDFLVQNHANITLQVAGAVDLTAGNISNFIQSVELAAGAELTLTADQLVAIGFADGDDADSAADNWSGLAGATLNIVDLSDQAIDLDAIQAAGITIGTVTIENTDDAITLHADTTFGGAAEIITPTAQTVSPEFGAEQTSLTMTVAQFLSSAGLISGDAQINLTGLINNVDTDGDYQLDSANYDFSGIANAATLTLTDATIKLVAAADLGGFEIVLANGQMIQFATETQASGVTISEAGLQPVTAVAWLFDAVLGQIDTTGYAAGINTLFVNEDLVDGANVEALWNTLAGTITVEVVNSNAIPDVLVVHDRTVVVEAMTGIDSMTFDDTAEFQTLENLTINLEGNTVVGNITVGDTVVPTSGPQAGDVAFNSLTINSYEDRTTIDNDNGFSFQPNKVGDIGLTAGSADDLMNVALGTGDFSDPVNVEGAAATRDGLALEVGTISFASNSSDNRASLTLTGDNDITIDGLDISDANVNVLEVDIDDFLTDAAQPDLTIAGVNINDLADDMQLADDTLTDNLDALYYIDSYVAETGDTLGFDPDGPETSADALLVVTNGVNDLTKIALADFDITGISFTGDATLTLTAAQVAQIGITDTDGDGVADNWLAAAGANVTLNIVDYTGENLDLNAIAAAGINIGTITVDDFDGTVTYEGTLGGADSVIVPDEDTTFSLTAEQYGQLEGAGTITGAGTVNITALMDGSTIDLSGVTAVNGTITLGDDDVALDAAAVLNGFSVTLNDVDSTGSADEAAGQTIRFATAVQAERYVLVTGFDGTAGLGTNGEEDTNVVWLFDTITGTAVAGKVDTSGYSAEIGRVWMLDTLVDGQNVEELYSSLAADIIVHIVNSADLDELLPVTTGFSRTVEIEAFTQLPNGLTFNDIDEAGHQPFDHVQNLTITLGGEVNLGDLQLDNILAEPIDNDDEFDTLTINSMLADNADDVLMPEGWDADYNPVPTGDNLVGDISSGANREELSRVVLNATEVGLQTGTITFSDDGNDPAQPADGDDAMATLTVTGDYDINIASVNTDDADITGITVNATGFSGTLTAPGTSPGFQLDNTEALVFTGEDTDAAESEIILGSVDNAGVSGNELSWIDARSYAGDLDLGVVSMIDGSDDDNNNDGDIEDVDDNIAFTFNAGMGRTTMTLGAADGEFPTLEAGSTWEFNGVNGDGVAFALTITEDVVFEAGGNLILNDLTLFTVGDVDFSQLALFVTDTTIIVAEGAVLTLTAAQASGLTIMGAGTVEILNLEETPAADLDGIMTGVFDTGVVNAYVDTADDDDADTDPEDVVLTGDLGVAHITVTGADTLAVDNMATMDDASFTVTAPATLLLTAEQADERVADGTGTVEVADLGILADDTDIDLTGLTATTVTAAVVTDFVAGDEADFGTAVVTVAASVTLTADAAVLDGQTINGAGAVYITDDATDVDFGDFGILNIIFDDGATVDNVTFPVLTAAIVDDPLTAEDETQQAQRVRLTSVQADGETITGNGEVVVEVTEDGAATAAFDLGNIAGATLTARFRADATLPVATDLGDFDVVIYTDATPVTLTIDGSDADGLNITEENNGNFANVIITNVQPGQDFTGIDVDNLTIQVATGVTEFSLAAAQADGAIVVFVDNLGTETLTITDLEDTPDADLSLLKTGGSTYTAVAELDSDTIAADLTADLSDVDTVEVTGDGNVVVGAAADLDDAVFDFVDDAPTLTLTADQADGLVTVDTAGAATVVVTALEDTPDANLSVIVANTETAALDSDGNVALTAQLGDGMVVTIADSDEADVATADGTFGTVTFTGTAGTASFVIADASTLTMSAALASARTITAGADGLVAITALDATLAADLSDITGTAGNITAAFGVSGTFTGDLGTAVVTVAGGVAFTADVAVVDGKSITGAGNVLTTGLADVAVDLSTITVAGIQLATLVDDTVTTDVALDTTTDLGDFNINSGATVTTLTLSAEQADDMSVTDGGALVDVNVTSFEDTPGADLSALDEGNYHINVALNSTGDVEIGATADLTGINGDSEVTISGTGVVTVAEGADVDDADFVVNTGATLVADHSLSADSIIDATGVTGAGTLLQTGLDGATVELTLGIRFTEAVFDSEDTNVTIQSFNAGTFAYTALENGYHALDFTDFFADATIQFANEAGQLAADQSGNANEIIAFQLTLADNAAGTVEAAFANTGVLAAAGDVDFGDSAAKIFLITDTTTNDTTIWHWTDGVLGGGGTVIVDGEVNDGELTLIGVLDGYGVSAELVATNFVLA
ncbi:DUF4214 domain-containing protein [Desulfuromonas thiophila]|uniref:DUF4214 domain-containing protein n=1 Tax=Desulfuromonas thiophila TaxID=57664 RepID=UPI0029F51F98|nr:DUF4214 domain-containing protein [Desulfuromonas thiophila]